MYMNQSHCICKLLPWGTYDDVADVADVAPYAPYSSTNQFKRQASQKRLGCRIPSRWPLRFALRQAERTQQHTRF